MLRLHIGFTPDPDDAFAYYALVHGLIETRGWRLGSVMTLPIEELNRRASAETIDVAAISSVHYPWVRERYAVLRSGASIGRGYGPALAARRGTSVDDLSGRVVAVPGRSTTGAALLELFFPAARVVSMPYESIRNAIVRGEVAGGVLIHEELLRYPDAGLERIVCLGATWSRETGLPLPVGLNVVRRSLGPVLMAEVCRAVRASVLWALENRQEAASWARRFGCRASVTLADRFIRMFTNTDTVDLPLDCERGLAELFDRLAAHGLRPRVPAVDVVELPYAPARVVVSLEPVAPAYGAGSSPER